MNTTCEVLVIGGGPAGMMAAIQAAKRGRNVLLLEKNDTLGKKLLITGGGRCNVTNAEFDTRTLLAKYKESDKYLFSTFSQFGVKDTLDFFHTRNLQTKVENEKRVFPITDKAQSVWDVLVQELRQQGVQVMSHAEVKGLIVTNGEVQGAKVSTKKGEIEIHAQSIVVATGGKSRPETGSTGDGFNWMKKLGHTIIEPEPSLVPIKIQDEWVKTLQGKTIDDVKITLYSGNAFSGIPLDKIKTKRGKILFTHFGLSGPTILNMSKDISEYSKYDDVYLGLDIAPALDHGKLNSALQTLFKLEINKKIKNALGSIITSAIVPYVINFASIDPDKACNSITREERMKLIEAIKNIKVRVDGLLGTDKAIVTSGGVDLDEIDFKTMRSKLAQNVFLVGDMLNIDRPSGGYSLQLCWTTGFVAGDNA